MILIHTRFIGPTDFKGARISARTASGRRAIVSFDYGAGTVEAHKRAAEAVALKLALDPDLPGYLAGYGMIELGETTDREGFIFGLTDMREASLIAADIETQVHA